MEGYRSVLPYLINDEGEPERERYQSAADRARYDDTTKCILCAACTTSLPDKLGRRGLCGARRHRERPPVHLRLSATTAP